MRRLRAALLFAALIMVSICLLFVSFESLKRALRKSRATVYQSASSIPVNECDTLIKNSSIVLFHAQKDVYAENSRTGRAAELTLIEVCGDCSLLFPGVYFPDSVYGNFQSSHACLLGKNLAWQLFGSQNPIGAKITCNQKEYEISGIVQEKNVLVIAGTPDADYEYLALAASDERTQNKLLKQLQNSLSLSLSELPLKVRLKMAKLFFCLCLLLSYTLFASAICRLFYGKKPFRPLLHCFITVGICALFAGLFYVLSLSAYSLPDRLSDLGWWSRYWKEETATWRWYFAEFRW